MQPYKRLLKSASQMSVKFSLTTEKILMYFTILSTANTQTPTRFMPEEGVW